MSPLRAFVHRFVLALGLAFAVSAGGIGFGLWLWNDTVDSAERVPGLDLAERERGEPANFLIIGSDTRSFVEDPLDVEHFGDEGDASGQRSDTIMIAHVDPDSKSGFLVSFPRDLWVDIPGRGEAKINAAFNDGPERVVDTIEHNFSVDIHHYLEVSFDGFRGLVDAIGDVPIFFPTPARDQVTGLLISEAGCHGLDGRQALAYVRSREYQFQVDGSWQTDGTGDLGRIRRQQYFIRSLADEAVRAGFRNPLKIDNILDEAFGNLRVDEGLSGNDLKTLINAFRDVDPAEVDMVTVPNRPERINGQAALRLIAEEAEPIFERLRFGDDGDDEQPPDIGPADIRVAVRNGSGVQGQARTAYDALTGLGFSTIDPPSNADRTDYAQTEVRYAPGAEGKARVVAAQLGGVGTLVELDQPPAEADVVVVLGRDFQAVGTAATPQTQPAAPAETAAPVVAEATTTTAPANPGSEAPLPVAGC